MRVLLAIGVRKGCLLGDNRSKPGTNATAVLGAPGTWLDVICMADSHEVGSPPCSVRCRVFNLPLHFSVRTSCQYNLAQHNFFWVPPIAPSAAQGTYLRSGPRAPPHCSHISGAPQPLSLCRAKISATRPDGRCRQFIELLRRHAHNTWRDKLTASTPCG
ncbi:hypothetical protein CYLTODRAFT_427801, partial [Cylindrobasidium torrendii FP15055 ss-10]